MERGIRQLEDLALELSRKAKVAWRWAAATTRCVGGNGRISSEILESAAGIGPKRPDLLHQSAESLLVAPPQGVSKPQKLGDLPSQADQEPQSVGDELSARPASRDLTGVIELVGSMGVSGVGISGGRKQTVINRDEVVGPNVMRRIEKPSAPVRGRLGRS